MRAGRCIGLQKSFNGKIRINWNYPFLLKVKAE
jgi:hypothetical protein